MIQSNLKTRSINEKFFSPHLQNRFKSSGSYIPSAAEQVIDFECETAEDISYKDFVKLDVNRKLVISDGETIGIALADALSGEKLKVRIYGEFRTVDGFLTNYTDKIFIKNGVLSLALSDLITNDVIQEVGFKIDNDTVFLHLGTPYYIA